MKKLDKINRGAMLTAFVLLCVIGYLVGLALVQNAAKPVIEQLCSDYIRTEVRYSMLPAQYRAEAPGMPDAERAAYLADMAKDIKAYLIDDELTSKFTVDNLQTRLENQMNGIGVIYDYQKTIVKFDSIIFSDGIVTVSVRTNTVFDGPVNNSLSIDRQQMAVETTDTLVVQKDGGQWKVVYASLTSPATDNSQNEYEYAGKY